MTGRAQQAAGPMPVRRRLVLLACACALALIPASAHAAVTQVVGLSSATNGIAIGADGNVYVVETVAQQVTVLTPDGRVVRRVHLDSNGATSAALGPDGQVWIAMTGADANRGFLRIAPDGSTTPVSTAALYQCGPVGMAPFGGRMYFTAPSNGSCGTHGLGSIGPNGETPTAAGNGTNVGFDLVVSGGKLFVPMFDDEEIVRRSITAGAPGPIEATFPTPSAAAPDGIAVGPDGDLWVTYFVLGEVARLSPSAANGTAPTIVAGGVDEPFGLLAHPDGGLYVNSNSDGQVVRIAADGSKRSLALPPGFHPWQLATVNRDTWVTDNVTAQVGRVVDDVPIPRLVADAVGVTAEVDPRGNETSVTLTVTPTDGAPIVKTETPIAAGIGEQPRGFFLAGLPAGSYSVTATAANARGTATTAPVAFSVPAIVLPSAPPAPAKLKKPTFAQVLSVASATKCLSHRRLTLTLRKRKTGSKVTAVAVTIGKGKAKTYKGAKLKLPVKLTGLPKGTFKVKVVATLADATKLTLTRTYKTCAAKKHR
jgi:streptogramin lyase